MNPEQLFRECVSAAKSLAPDAMVFVLGCPACGVRVVAAWQGLVRVERHASNAHDAIARVFCELLLLAHGARRAPGGCC